LKRRLESKTTDILRRGSLRFERVSKEEKYWSAGQTKKVF